MVRKGRLLQEEVITAKRTEGDGIYGHWGDEHPREEGRRRQCLLESKKELEVFQENKDLNFVVPGAAWAKRRAQGVENRGADVPSQRELQAMVRTRLHPHCDVKPAQSLCEFMCLWAFPWGLSGKESTCQCRRHRFDPWVGKIPLEKEMATHSSILAWEIPWTEDNWCFWILILEKTLECPLGCKEMNQSILKEINTEYSLEGLMLKRQYFGHLLWRAYSLERILMQAETEGKRRRGRQKMRCLDNMTKWANSAR